MRDDPTTAHRAAVTWLLMDNRGLIHRYLHDAEFHAAVYRSAIVLTDSVVAPRS